MPFAHRRSQSRRLRPVAGSLEERTLLTGPVGLDTSFGSAGVLVDNHLAVSNIVSVEQSDDKLLMAADDTITRHNPDGSVDTSFGQNGVAKVNLSAFAPGSTYFTISNIAVAPDGKIVVAGYVSQSQQPSDLQLIVAVARFNADGSPDTSFGQGSVAIASPVNAGNASSGTVVEVPDLARAVTVAADGSILVAGQNLVESTPINPDSQLRYHFGVVKFLSNGSPDPSFGSNGLFDDDFSNGQALGSQAESVAIGPDGKILVGGLVNTNPISNVFQAAVLVRLDASGVLDSSFGTGGMVIPTATDTSYETETLPNGQLALLTRGGVLAFSPLSDGSFVAAIETYDPQGNNVSEVIKVDANGALDTQFGPIDPTTGVRDPAPTFPCDDEGAGVIVLPDGSLVSAGTNTTPSAIDGNLDDIINFVATRVLTDGTVASSFSTLVYGETSAGAIMSTPLPVGQTTSIAVGPDGRLVVAGLVQTGTTTSTAVYQGITIPITIPVYGAGATRLLTSFIPGPLPAVANFNFTITKHTRNIGGIVLTFNKPMDAAAAGAASNYTLIAAGADRRFGTKDDKTLVLASVTYNAATDQVTIVPKKKLSKQQPLELTIASGALQGEYGDVLDGDGDGKPGGAYTVMFGTKPRPPAPVRKPHVRAKRI